MVDGESLLHLEIDRETDPTILASLRDEVAGVLADVRVVVAEADAARASALLSAAGETVFRIGCIDAHDGEPDAVVNV